MFRKLILPASLGLAALTALIPNAASAQRYDGWRSQSYSGYGYRDDNRYRDRGSYNHRDGYLARQRWIAHRRWEEEQRRREWREHRRYREYRRDSWNGDYRR